MTSLAEVYHGGSGRTAMLRVYGGASLFAIGLVLTLFGIGVGTSTSIAASLSYGVYEAREVAGIAAGVGLPAAFGGVLVLLPPRDLRMRLLAGIGAGVTLLAVLVFQTVYPTQWYGMPVDHTLSVTSLYFIGAVTTIYTVFDTVAKFKTRNDPGGTVRLQVLEKGQTKVVEVSGRDLRSRLSGIGLLGETPDGSVKTQTARQPSPPSEPTGPSTAPAVQPDNQSPTEREMADDAVFLEEELPSAAGDDYCGNCTFFKYARGSSGLQPYCGYHDELMDDMDPCDQWQATGGSPSD